jgi:hypothetical protein
MLPPLPRLVAGTGQLTEHPCSRPQAITGPPEVYAAALYASKGRGFGGEGDWVEGYKLEGVSQAYYQP